MNTLNRLGVPMAWTDVFARAVVTAVAGFGALVVKEWLETQEWDLIPCAVDAACVAGAVLVLNGLLMIAFPPRKSER